MVHILVYIMQQSCHKLRHIIYDVFSICYLLERGDSWFNYLYRLGASHGRYID